MEELFGGGKEGKDEKQHLVRVKNFVSKILTPMVQVQL